MSGTRALFVCDGARVPAALSGEVWDTRRAINHRGPTADLTLRAENLASKILGQVSDRAADLVRIAAYAYAADQGGIL